MDDKEKPQIYIPKEGELKDLEGLGELKGSFLFQPGERVMVDDHLLVINAKPIATSEKIRIEKVPYQFMGLFVERLIEPGVDQKVGRMLRQYDSVKTQFELADPFYMSILTDPPTDSAPNGRRAVIAAYFSNGNKENSAGIFYFYERCVFINGVGILLHQVVIRNPRGNIEQRLLAFDQELLQGKITARKLLGLEAITDPEEQEPDDGGIAVKEFEEAYCRPFELYSQSTLLSHEKILAIINQFKKALLN